MTSIGLRAGTQSAPVDGSMSAPLRIGRWRVVVVTIAALLLVGSAAGASGASTAGSTVRAGGPITNCTAKQTRSALVSFMAAFSAGDYRRLDALFAGPSWFRWYSSSAPGVRFDPQAQRRNTLIAYFRIRHAQRDRLRLMSFKFNGNSLGYGNFIWKMKRSAGDFRAGAWFTVEAKGAALCEGASARFIVMSVGAPDS
ncbi:MAG: hypothetical protein ACYDCH_10560 [Gaiellaceae bacterium]